MRTASRPSCAWVIVHETPAPHRLGFRRLETNPPPPRQVVSPRSCESCGWGGEWESDHAGTAAVAHAVDLHRHGEDGLASLRGGFQWGGSGERANGARVGGDATMQDRLGTGRRTWPAQSCRGRERTLEQFAWDPSRCCVTRLCPGRAQGGSAIPLNGLLVVLGDS
jgi:hypothetical protein